MLLGNLEKVFVYQLDNQNFTLLGIIDDVISVNWAKHYNKYSDVYLSVIPSERNLDLLQKGRVLWIGGDNAARIDIVEKDEDNGKITLQVKGQTLEKLLTQRILHVQLISQNRYISQVIASMVQYSCITPAKLSPDETAEQTAKSIIPFLENMENIPNIGRQINDILWRGALYEKVKAYADSEENVGFEILFKPDLQKLIFQVYEGQDHTITSNSPVVFTDKMEAILSLEYYNSIRDYKNIAYVFGEGEGQYRRWNKAGDDTSTGFDRYEDFIDARDIQSEVEEGQTIPDEEYMEMLRNRGLEKLAEQKEVKTISGKLDVENSVYKYGVDYKIGDKITVINSNLGIQIDAQVTGIQESVGNSYSTELIVGYDIRTLAEKMKTLYG